MTAMITGRATMEQLPDGTWKATCPIESLFGAEVDGKCSGFGETKEAALKELEKDKEKIQESLWV